jgi:DNA-binding CsgD family transcriptional regulator
LALTSDTPRKLDQIFSLQEKISTHSASSCIREVIFHDIVELLDADFAASFLWDEATKTSKQGISYQIPDKKMSEYGEHFQYRDPHTAKMRSFRRAVLADEAMRSEDLQRTEFFNEFLTPIGMSSGLNVFLFDGDKDLGDFRLWRSSDKKPFSEADRLLLDSIAAPIRRAVIRQRAAFEGLTARECDVALLVSRGCRDQDIARVLGISLSTARTHLNHAMDKRNCSNRAELAVSIITHRQ